MTWTLSDSGTTAALTVGTETTLATDTTNNTFVLEVDTSNLVLGDLLELRIYTIALSGGSLTQAWKGSYQHAQINNHKISPPIASDQSIKCTIKQVAGTGRTFAWKMLTVPYISVNTNIAVNTGTDVGSNTAGSDGTIVVPNASADTKGVYAQLIASTAANTDFITINVLQPDNAGAGITLNSTIDIATGAGGSEVVLINNLQIQEMAHRAQGTSWSFPIHIPSGTRIAARVASGQASGANCLVSCQLYQSNTIGHAGVDSVGYVTANTNGTAITANTTTINTKGPYVNLISSSIRAYYGVAIGLDTVNLTSIDATCFCLLDIATGPVASETVIIPNYAYAFAASGLVYPMNSAVIPVQIPAGTRICARLQANTTDTTEIVTGVTLYGVY